MADSAKWINDAPFGCVLILSRSSVAGRQMGQRNGAIVHWRFIGVQMTTILISVILFSHEPVAHGRPPNSFALWKNSAAISFSPALVQMLPRS